MGMGLSGALDGAKYTSGAVAKFVDGYLNDGTVSFQLTIVVVPGGAMAAGLPALFGVWQPGQTVASWSFVCHALAQIQRGWNPIAAAWLLDPEGHPLPWHLLSLAWCSR